MCFCKLQKYDLFDLLFRGRSWIRQGSPELIKRVGGLSSSSTHTVYNNWQIKQ
ncbi:hypothetical protein BN1325_110087 [Staphylococcus aureus]|nr:hypothetical protein SAET23_120085 [Staphylococcus aureus]CRI11486.1 hypothetical protein BN1322_120086 [Staphylococcus aureus]CRI14142.1 hypothetical protein BN1325_110087 [Staphylococcus aureus]CRI18283.1 hypothetical protein SAET23_120085 [Staphylococcus aureus]CRI20696.1 hypothetical protein BN1323_340340 [Staphylococcus aureus]